MESIICLKEPVVLTDITCDESCRMPGIYGILNTQNGKIYVGSSINSMSRRWHLHESRLKSGGHSNPHLVASYEKYGPGSFKYIVLEMVDDLDKITEREQWWIDKMRDVSPGVYNMMPAERHLGGQVFTDEHRANISKAHKGKKPSAEIVKKRADAHRGMKHNMSDSWRINTARGHEKPYPAFINENTGEVIPAGEGLQRICRDRGISSQGMFHVKSCRVRMCEGWVLEDSSPWDAKTKKTAGEKASKRKAAAIERFWGKVDVRGEDECWEWIGGKTACYNGKVERPHRTLWRILNGDIPDDAWLVRTCNNLNCVNPAHVEIGTAADVAKQVKARGNSGKGGRSGEDRADAKLNWEKVRFIRTSGMRTCLLAKRFDVSDQCISSVKYFRTWKNDPLDKEGKYGRNILVQRGSFFGA